jgi:DNA topoisomerase-1
MSTTANVLNNLENPEASAKEAGLKYSLEITKGIKRIRAGKGFNYVDSEGKRVSDENILKRINSLVIPPAWENVFISSSPKSHLQAVGIDAKGRKQYKYHPDWILTRNETKFGRLYEFGRCLSAIRKQNKRHLRLKGMPRDKALAIIVSILDKAFIRVGNAEYEKINGTYGLTTLRDKHAHFGKDSVEFVFKAKSGKESIISLEDKVLSKLVKKCKEIPGYHLFQYYDENGNHIEVHSHDVNDYLKQITGKNFTAKDFRTWGGTVEAYNYLKKCVREEKTNNIKKEIVECVKEVAAKLHNTVAICRKYYIHPLILDSFETGEMFRIDGEAKKGTRELRKEEREVITLLRKAK